MTKKNSNLRKIFFIVLSFICLTVTLTVNAGRIAVVDEKECPEWNTGDPDAKCMMNNDCYLAIGHQDCNAGF